MAKNLNQIATAASSILATDKMYIARSPFGVTDDRYILGSTIISQLSPLTTKGDIYTFSTVNARLPVASGDGKILQVSSGAATGLAWSTPTYPSASATSGKILISDGTNFVSSISLWPNTVGTAGKILISDGISNVYSTPTYPNASVTAGKIIISDGTNYIASTPTFANTYAISTILYASSADTVTGLATANSSSLVTSSAGVPFWSNNSGLVSITEITGASQTIVINNGYIANNAGGVAFTLPATAAVGTLFAIQGSGSGGWSIAQNANQILHVGSVASTAGVTGSVSSSNRYNSVIFVCIVSGLEWVTFGGPQGNLTIL